MSANEKVAIVCEKFPLPSQTFVDLHVELLQAEVFTLEQATPMTGPQWAGRVHAVGMKSGQNRLRVLVEKIWRRLTDSPWRIWWPGDQRRLRQWLSKRQITSALVEFGQCFVGCGQAVLDSGVKVVPHFHGVDLSAHLRNERYVRRLRPLLRQCTDVIVVNDEMRERLQDVLGYRGRIHLVPYAANTSRFGYVERVGHEGVKFLFVGRLVDKKGPMELIRSFALYRKAGGAGTLILAGDGPLRGAVSRLISESGLTEQVELMGVVTPAQVVALMAEADVYVQHSRVTAEGDEEGWPVAIAEACLTALPVIATNHAGIPSQVISGQTGFLVNEGDVEGMARAMLQLAGSPEMRTMFGQAGRKHIQQYCDLTSYRNRLAEILAHSARVPTGAI